MEPSRLARKFVFPRRGAPTNAHQTFDSRSRLQGESRTLEVGPCAITGGRLRCVANVKLQVRIKPDLSGVLVFLRFFGRWLPGPESGGLKSVNILGTLIHTFFLDLICRPLTRIKV